MGIVSRAAGGDVYKLRQNLEHLVIQKLWTALFIKVTNLLRQFMYCFNIFLSPKNNNKQ